MPQYLQPVCHTGVHQPFLLSDLLLFVVLGISVIASSISLHLSKAIATDSLGFSASPNIELGLRGYEDQHKRCIQAKNQSQLYRKRIIVQFHHLILKFQQKAQATHLKHGQTKAKQ